VKFHTFLTAISLRIQVRRCQPAAPGELFWRMS
jgi:hypothetical protein